MKTLFKAVRALPTHYTLAAVLWLAPLPLQAQFDFVTNNGAITIYRYTGPGGDVVIPSETNGMAVTSIGGYAFQLKFSLTNLTIPNSVTSIGERAFYYCTNLTCVTIPDSVTAIGEYAFLYCYNLSNVAIPTNLTTIAPGTFSACRGLTTIAIPDNVTTIGLRAFYGCTSLTHITIPDSVTGIPEEAFAFCGSLTSLMIPDNIATVGNSAFWYCANLTDVTIGNSVTNIGESAFESCTSLTNVTIPNRVANIGLYAFSSCRSLTEITVAAGNPSYSSREGVLLNANQTVLIQHPPGKGGTYVIPNSVSTIVEYAFAECIRLTSVIIPEKLTTLGEGAFYECTALTGVYFKGNAPSAGGYIFENSTYVIVYYLPGTIGWGPTFGGCPTTRSYSPDPIILTLAPYFGVRSNQFGFRVSWLPYADVVVESTTDLSFPNWSPVATYTLTNAWCYFSDPDWTNYPARFYRVRSP